MSVYFDTSVLVALFTEDIFSGRADALMRDLPVAPLLSDFAAAEFSSVVARHVRMSQLGAPRGSTIFADFDRWRVSGASQVDTVLADIQHVELIVRRFDLNLRAPDAIHIATANRVNAVFATFDLRQAACAKILGLALAEG